MEQNYEQPNYKLFIENDMAKYRHQIEYFKQTD